MRLKPPPPAGVRHRKGHSHCPTALAPAAAPWSATDRPHPRRPSRRCDTMPAPVHHRGQSRRIDRKIPGIRIRGTDQVLCRLRDGGQPAALVEVGCPYPDNLSPTCPALTGGAFPGRTAPPAGAASYRGAGHARAPLTDKRQNRDRRRPGMAALTDNDHPRFEEVMPHTEHARCLFTVIPQASAKPAMIHFEFIDTTRRLWNGRSGVSSSRSSREPRGSKPRNLPCNSTRRWPR